MRQLSLAASLTLVLAAVAGQKGDALDGARPTRRDFLYAGWLGGLGPSLGSFLKLEAARANSVRRTEAKAKSVIHIYLQGGFAHMDSFDPKRH